MTPTTLHLYNLSPSVIAFSTTRHGGVSEGSYSTFNVNAYCGDQPQHVAENRRQLCEALGIAATQLIIPHQVHGLEVRQIGAEFASLPENIRQMILEGVDAVITDQPRLCIGVSTADCIPVLLYDEAHHAVAAIHAGWRGTMKRICMKTVAAMRMAYHTDPKELKAIIGPGILLDAFEVGDEVYEAFQKEAFDMKQIAARYPNSQLAEQPDVPEKWHIDLPLCNALQLQQTGIPVQNIYQSDICTYHHSDEYFSARKLGTDSGRIYTGIIIK